MGPIGAMHRAIDWAAGLPAVRHIRRKSLERQFATRTDAHLFSGVFDSFEAAVASAPAARPIGYDNPASASLYVSRLRIDEYDYPSMFWLACSMTEGMTRIADVGGSVGIKYFAFSELMDFPTNLLWRVIDVPAAVERGRRFATARGAGAALEFSSRLSDVDATDVIFASGSLQYLPQSLGEILSAVDRKPRRIIVNTTPIHAERSFFTLNNIGTAYCAYRVQSLKTFVDGIEANGYRLRDRWLNLGKRMELPLEPGLSIDHYSGFCFDLKP